MTGRSAFRRESWLIPTLSAVAVVAANAAAVAINVATSAAGEWPWGLDAIRTHPFWSSAGFTAAAAGAAAWWLQQRAGRVEGTVPAPQAVPDWVVDRPAEANHVVAALRRRGGGAVGITTALYGTGGFGKTTLAQVVCADRRVRRRFGGRIYWVTIGRDVRGKAVVLAKVNDVITLVPARTPPSPTRSPRAGAWARCWTRGRAGCCARRRVTLRAAGTIPRRRAAMRPAGRHTHSRLLAGQGALPAKVDQMSAAQARELLTCGGGTRAGPRTPGQRGSLA